MPLSSVPSKCMDNAAPGAVLHVVVVASPQAGQVLEQLLRLPLGATVADAVQASGWSPGGVPSPQWVACGVWGRVVAPQQQLRDQDRVELYRPLSVDPKVARRERFARQGARAAGLFARQRAVVPRSD